MAVVGSPAAENVMARAAEARVRPGMGEKIDGRENELSTSLPSRRMCNVPISKYIVYFVCLQMTVEAICLSNYPNGHAAHVVIENL